MVRQMGSVEDEREKLSQEASTGKVADLQTKLANAKESQAWQELKNKEAEIKSLKMELEKAKEMEAKLQEKDVCLQKLNEELIKAKSSKPLDHSYLSSETNMVESFAAQSEQLVQTKISLEESKLEIKSLQQKLESVDVPSENSNVNLSKIASLERQLEILKSSQETEQRLLSSEKGLVQEMNLLRNKLKLATEDEEKSRKAMEDLALALTEVATEAKQAKEKLASTEKELQSSKGLLVKLQTKLKTVKEIYTEAKKEAETYKHTAERLRLEEEESHFAWNAKETGFVECIRKAEEERDEALESVRIVEEMLRKQKEETQKLRDILKQALNESNVAKEAAEIAREENSQLKDALAQKDKSLNFLSQENEDLKINEAAAFDNIKELKRLLHEAMTPNDGNKKPKPQKSAENEHKDDKDQGKKQKEEKEHKGGWRLMSNTFGLKWQSRHKEADEEQKTANKESDHVDDKEHSVKLVPQASPKPSSKASGSPKLSPKASPKLTPQGSPKLIRQQGSVESDQKDENEHTRKLKPQDFDQKDDEYEGRDPLKGSIFDAAETPDSSSESAEFDGEAMSVEDSDQLDPTNLDDTETQERSSTRKKALLRRFGDLIGSKSSHQRKVESTLDQ